MGLPDVGTFQIGPPRLLYITKGFPFPPFQDYGCDGTETRNMFHGQLFFIPGTDSL